jgi:ABC-2 type transport system ATP-binding protein
MSDNLGPASSILDIRKLSYRYEKFLALSDVSLAVNAGQFMALLGPNGAGKTTLFSLITRLFDSKDGAIHIGGIDLGRQPTRAMERIGVVFQQPTLDLDLTVEQNLLYFASLHGIARREADVRIRDELARLDMVERKSEKVRHLNGGHRRRVEIARSLLHRPALLLLDEPTVGLDVPTRRRLVDYIHALCREKGIAVLWATHLIDEVDEGDQLIILHQGRVRAQGSVAEVLAGAGTPSLATAFDYFIGQGEAA